MPVREGRWVSWASLAATEEAAAEAVATPADEPVAEAPKRKSRKSAKAAEAAVLDATGVTIDLASLEMVSEGSPAIGLEDEALATPEQIAAAESGNPPEGFVSGTETTMRFTEKENE